MAESDFHALDGPAEGRIFRTTASNVLAFPRETSQSWMIEADPSPFAPYDIIEYRLLKFYWQWGPIVWIGRGWICYEPITVPEVTCVLGLVAWLTNYQPPPLDAPGVEIHPEMIRA